MELERNLSMFVKDINYYRHDLSSDITNMEIVNSIISINKHFNEFWSNAQGWAPVDVAGLLSKSRLDWQESLSNYLMNWVEKTYVQDDHGALILAWANLGSLVEGTMKLLLAIYYQTYQNDVDRIIKRGQTIEPDVLMLEDLRVFFRGKIWKNNCDWDKWITHIQMRRNAIHSFRNRDIGDFEEYFDDLRIYLALLKLVIERVPWPDEVYMPF